MLSLYKFGSYQLDPVGRKVWFREARVHLTRKEFLILHALVSRAGADVETGTLLNEVWPGASVLNNNLTPHVRNLRTKLQADGTGREHYVVTVFGDGYRLGVPVTKVDCADAGDGDVEVDLVEVKVTAGPQPLPGVRSGAGGTPRLDHSTGQRFRRWAAVVLALAIVGIGGVLFVNRHRVSAYSTSPPVLRFERLLALASSEGKTPMRLNLGHEIGWLLVTPDSKQLYAVELFGRTITVLGVEDLRIKRRIQLPYPARGAVISRDGRRLYIGSPHNAVMIVEMLRGRVERVIETGGPVFDLAVTPDEQKLFLAMGNKGLKRIFLNSGEIKSLSEFACPLFLAMDAQGKRLFVSYQCDGPGGRAGHNPVESYDINSEQRLGAAPDLPMVGGPPVVAPQGDLILLDGLDACVTKAYDQLGCPEAPSHVFHLLRTSDFSVVKSFSLPVGTYGAAFSPDGSHLVFGGQSFVAMDTARRWVTEKLPFDHGSFSQFAFTPNGRRVFVGSAEGTDLLAFDAEEQGCGPSPPGIANQYSGDGTLSDSNGDYPLRALGTVRFVPGLIGQAFQFKGGGNVLEPNAGGACWSCSGAWTESFFTKFDSVDGEMTLLERVDASDGWAHRFFKAEDNRIVLEVGGVSARRLISSSTPALPNRWYHLALVADTTHRSFYIDGMLQGQMNLAEPYDTALGPGRVFLGANRSGRIALNGLMDEIAWYERALEADEVRNLAQSVSQWGCRHPAQ